MLTCLLVFHLTFLLLSRFETYRLCLCLTAQLNFGCLLLFGFLLCCLYIYILLFLSVCFS